MSKLSRLKNWLKIHRKAFIISLVVTFIASGSLAAMVLGSNNYIQRIGRETSAGAEKPITKPAPLTGVEVDPKIAKEPVTAVMIENSPDARPQSGLDSAGIVFETVAEGGITRFLALYQDKTPKKIGPIRSLRPYYVDWFMGFDAAIAHVGGSAQALQLVANRNAKTLTQFSHAGAYYRSSDRAAPHNVYSSIADLRSLQKSLGYNKSEFPLYLRSDDEPAEDPKTTRITVDYSSSLYQAQFRYNQSGNNYTRYLSGQPHIDRETGKAITTKNVVVIHMPTRQSGQYVVMDNIGSGDAVLFKNGNAHKVKWRQRSHKNRMEILNSDGDAVALNRGKTWFAVLPSGRSLDY